MSDSAKKVFKKGDILIREGDAASHAYIIESGHVEILIQREGQLLQLGTRGPGSIIGEMAMLDDKPRTATVRALESGQAIEVSRADFARRVEAADPVLKMALHVVMTRYRDMISRSHFVLPGPFSDAATEVAENSGHLHSAAVGAIKVLHELKAALQKGELLLHYQPIIDIRDMKIAGFEALMRWKHPERGLIPPGVFIPVAEESGLIVDLSHWALGVSCDAAKQLRAAASPALLAPQRPLFVSVNFCVKDFVDENFFARVQATLRDKGADPSCIHIEITESLLMKAPGAAEAVLRKCRDHGIGVSIDDFGTGYSSLSYLHHFPVGTLKIDQSFIRSMTSNPASLVLVKSIIALARNLQMNTIAEGIESPQEAALVRELGCHECQGYWFARPMPLAEALQFVRSWAPPQLS